MKKVLFVFWHGLGDNILATPAIRTYRLITKNRIGWAMLRRFKSAQLFRHNPDISDIYWISDAWNDFGSYAEGQAEVMREAMEIADREGYDEVIPIPHSVKKHKIIATAEEMGVDLGGDYRTEFFYDRGEVEQFYRCIELPDEYVFFHGETGVKKKDLPRKVVVEDLKKRGIELPIVSPGYDWDISSIPISFAVDVMRRASHIYVADSVMYHMAIVFGLDIDLAYFQRGERTYNVVKGLVYKGKENIVFKI